MRKIDWTAKLTSRKFWAAIATFVSMMIVAIGKGIEKIELKKIAPDESHAYYREDGIHYVPKVGLEDLLI